MRFTPVTAIEAETGSNKFEPFKPGVYDFEIVKAEDAISEAGNEQIHLEMNIFNSAGEKRYVHDYLVSTPGVQYKVRHFCEAVGLLDQYENGSLDADMCEGVSGQCRIKIDPAKGQYAAKNAVQDYVPQHAVRAANVAPSGERMVPRQTTSEELSDDIPF